MLNMRGRFVVGLLVGAGIFCWTGVAEVRALEGERCFGAVGLECAVAFCAGNRCQINGGSWEHDECCWAEKVKGTGKSCVSYVPGVSAPVCHSSWTKANARTTSGFNWVRTVDTNKRNATGKVVFSEYCAQKGSRVHKDDVKYCCSKKATNPPFDHPDARICN
jgi:hypothetical protein